MSEFDTLWTLIGELHELVGDYLSQEGACPESDPDSDDPLCEQDDCTYCAIARKHYQLIPENRRAGVMTKRKPLGPYKDAAERIGLIVFSNQDYIDDTGHITEKIDEIEKLLMDKFEAK